MCDARWGDPREYAERDRGDERPRVYDARESDDHDPRDSLMHDLDLHLSPAATEDAIRLLDGRQSGLESVVKFGDILDTGGAGG